MASVAATRSRRGLPDFLRFVLFGGLLVVAIIPGLLAMHTLNLHGTPSAHAPAAMSVTVADSSEPHQGVAHHGSTGSPGLTSGTAHDRGGSCADCGGGDHLGMAMACVLALLLALLVLVPPRLLPEWMHTAPRPFLVKRFIDRLLSRAPSLQVLCISRT
ncbi:MULTISPECIES: DUF6153 family protein [Citricoccus]|uniref:DUF6153 family protein n=1 Tax=Citricoccus muralis TaxID=169134 RepID=A0ABY8H645_9MICC|nr:MULTISPECIES: DUF6153 family protein [Citricoccus]WBL19890.1 DUF6153 family protein [Citricoccus sp. NR2]WFP16614.1 DUF6153 family protein [Citricoccus muralis]